MVTKTVHHFKANFSVLEFAPFPMRRRTLEGAYVSAVERVTKENLNAGFITRNAAEQTIREAKASGVGQSKQGSR